MHTSVHGWRHQSSQYISRRACDILIISIVQRGSDAIRAALSWWTLAMLLYPETQKRAQEELDMIVGRARVPTFADMANLPYVRAMVKEVVRWRPVTPLGMLERVYHRVLLRVIDNLVHFTDRM